MVMACVLLPACAGDEGKGKTVPTDRIIHPWLSSSPGFNARSGATGSKVTAKEDNGDNEATAAQEPSDGFPLPPADELKGTTVSGNDAGSAPAVSPSPGFKAGSGATGSKLTPKEDSRVKAAKAVQEPSNGFPLSPADELKGTTVRVDGAASPPAVTPSPGFKVADGTVIARDESMKVVRFLGDNLSTVDCLLLTSDLV